MMIAFGGYIFYTNHHEKGIPILHTEEEKIDISELYVYGTHLNMKGTILGDGNFDLVLYDGEFLPIKINVVDGIFNLSEKINDGMNLESIPIGTYYIFLRSTQKDEDGNDVFRYYVLNNTTKYQETIYYTFSNIGNKIIINSDNDYQTLMVNVVENSDKEIYDVVVDAGHGGMDSGANSNGNREADYTMKAAISLREKLEKYGVKVKFTREANQLSSSETLSDYGQHGRAVIPHEVHAKYVFSLHLNSNGYSSVHGLEVYTPNNINYDFAKKLVSSIVTNTKTSVSTNRINRISDGIYTRIFTEDDIEISKKTAAEKNRKVYDVTTKSNYYYMIRETGGIMTGAYVDSRNEPDVMGNPYYNSNIGTEAYLIELGYLTNPQDLDNISKNLENYTTAIADTFNEIFIKNLNEES